MNLTEDIYKGLLVTNNPGPEVLTYEGKAYYRYMDRFYTPQVPASLKKEEVKALSEIRLKLADEIIDTDYSLMVIDRLYSIIEESSKGGCIVDFGCGGGFLNELFNNNRNNISSPGKIIGLDISDFAIKIAHKKYHSSMKNIKFSAYIFDEETTLDLESNSIDSIISSFVMHFNIYDHQISELFRILKPGGCFVYNDYVFNKYKGHFKKTASSLKKHGFIINDHNESFIHPHTSDIKNHRFVTAYKPDLSKPI